MYCKKPGKSVTETIFSLVEDAKTLTYPSSLGPFLYAVIGRQSFAEGRGKLI